MRVLVLGASGYIGHAVAHALAAAGHAVLCPCRDPSRAPIGPGIEPGTGDLADLSGLDVWFERADAVIHCAASWAGDMPTLDAALVTRLLRFPGRIIYTGGIWLFGPAEGLIDEATPLNPPDDFGWMRDGWLRLAAGHADAVLVHPALVWDEVLGGELRFLRNPADLVPGPGRQRWPLVHRDDLAEAYGIALTQSASGSVLIAVTDRGIPLSQLAPGRPAGITEPTDPRCWDQQASGERLRSLGWRPRRHALELLSTGVAR